MTTHLILGTAGHIDHGKTSLIRALTGTDTDRLPEEKRRGITIELGFAELTLGDFCLGIVDVPGHERFVRQMLAGATGMDIAMLVVAADDSVKPQTREHLEVLRLLDLPAGVIALTKCDLADADWIELVEAEVAELVEGTFLENAPIIRTSSSTGDGLEELATALTAAAEKAAAAVAEADPDAPFRMAIDRTFTIAGHGTVVTGSVSSGHARLGDELVIEPGGVQVRLRGLQNHDRTVEEIGRGQRAAINIAGIRHDEIGRGHELASPGHLVPSRLLTTTLTMVDSAARPLKTRDRVRVHLGTAEIQAVALLLGQERLEPGQEGFAQFFLRDEAVSIWNQPLVVRSESPVQTIGGGRVLVPAAQKLKRPSDEVFAFLENLKSDDEVARSSAALFFAGTGNWEPRDLSRTAGVKNVDKAHKALKSSGHLLEIKVSPRRTVRMHRQALDAWGDRICKSLEALHELNPLKVLVDRTQLTRRFRYAGDELFLEAILQQLAKQRRIRLTDRGVALAGKGPQLSADEEKLMDQLVAKFEQARFQPPTIKECQKENEAPPKKIKQLIELAAAEERLVHINGDMFMHFDAEAALREELKEKLDGSQGMTLSEIRELLATTRKYAVPICEYLDKIGFTRRNGDLRVLNQPAKPTA